MAQLAFFEDDCYWIQVRDGNLEALKIFSRHYSKRHYADNRRVSRIVGPGERIVLLGRKNDALFVWRKFISMDGQQGINCSVFRNESKVLSSLLLQQAEDIASKRWPGQRFYTYVNPKKVKSKNPGYCFLVNGWRKCGRTKKRNLIILEK